MPALLIREFLALELSGQAIDMNAQPSDLIRLTSALSEDVTRPIAGSQKIYVQGSRPDIRVPMREIALADTPTSAVWMCAAALPSACA